jgi:hypothetical protein
MAAHSLRDVWPVLPVNVEHLTAVLATAASPRAAPLQRIQRLRAGCGARISAGEPLTYARVRAWSIREREG